MKQINFERWLAAILLLFFMILAKAQGLVQQSSSLGNQDTSELFANDSSLKGQIGGLAAQKIATTVNYLTIKQIGDYNSNDIDLHTESSSINLAQIGHDNRAIVNLNAANISYNLLQKGYKNRVLEFGSKSPDLQLQRLVIQSGNAHNVIIHGSNAITEKVKINMQGNGKSVVIRNFN